VKFFYFIDPSATSSFTTNATGYVTALDVSFPVVPADVGGVAVDGTASSNQIKSGVVSQSIAPWTPGAALWLGWEMTDSTGKAQGVAIDNLTFSALGQKLAVLVSGALRGGRTNFVLSWPTLTGLEYQIEYRTNLTAGSWQPLGGPLSGDGNTLIITNSLLPSAQGFYRLKIMP
jgi:hypothetical protein